MTTHSQQISVVASLLAALTLHPATASAQTFSFAGYSWDQADTPDVAVPLGPGTVEGAVFTAHPSSTANVSGFPDDATGFDGALSPGRLLGLSTTGVRAVNLPSGNNGTTARSGFQLSWSLGRRMQNQLGDDFVIYESASASTSPEGFMVQVRNADTQVWSRWYYDVPDAHDFYVGEPSEGAFATAFDLDDFGVGAFNEIDAVRIANITDEDRVDPPGTEISPGIFVATGFIRPEDLGTTSDVLPDPGPMASYEIFGASTLDPDILYFGALSPPNICGDGVVRAGEACDDGNTADLDGCSANCQPEVAQTRQQSNCLKGLNTGGVRVALVQARASQSCLLGARRGEIPDAQACLTADTAGRMLKARAKTSKLHDRLCGVPPAFGQTDVDAINDAAAEESLGLTGDVFGPDLGAAAILESTDSLGAKCQAAVVKGYEKLAATKRTVFLKCKRTGLVAGTIVSAAGLEACLDVVLTDPKGKSQLARTRLESTITNKCAGVDLAAAFPGECSGAATLSTCLDEQVNCRVCRAFNRMDLLARDCDAYDDGTRNGTCPE